MPLINWTFHFVDYLHFTLLIIFTLRKTGRKIPSLEIVFVTRSPSPYHPCAIQEVVSAGNRPFGAKNTWLGNPDEQFQCVNFYDL